MYNIVVSPLSLNFNVFTVRLVGAHPNTWESYSTLLLLQPSNPDTRTERDVILYHAYVAQKKYGVVLDEIRSSHPSELQAVKMFAEYLSNESRRYDNALSC